MVFHCLRSQKAAAAPALSSSWDKGPARVTIKPTFLYIHPHRQIKAPFFERDRERIKILKKANNTTVVLNETP